MDPGRTTRLRRQCDTQLRLLTLFAVVTRNLDPTLQSKLAGVRRVISRGNKRQLESLAEELGAVVAETKRELGATRPNKELLNLLESLERNPGELVFFPKFILTRLFPKMLAMLPKLAELPEHARLSLDPSGKTPFGTGEVRIIEAGLFEDLAALFNLALERSAEASSPHGSKVLLKQSAALRRGVVSTAFYFVEAYLNSLAFDHLAAGGASNSLEDHSLLTEWDERKNRQRFTPFRDKLLQYPKIILGVQHPPLTETNCPELKYLLEEAKSFRDSIVHASPLPPPNEIYQEKEFRFWEIGLATPSFRHDPADPEGFLASDTSAWIRVADCSIVVVRRIETLVHGDLKRLWWLTDRVPGGAFPASTFE